MNPFNQFKLYTLIPIKIFNIDISLTNSGVFMLMIPLLILILSYLIKNNTSYVPNKLQSAIEIFYIFIKDTVYENTGALGLNYLPFFMSLFLFIFTGNLLGMIPGFFTVTSHLSVTLILASIVIGYTIILGIQKHKLHFFKIFFYKKIKYFYNIDIILMLDVFLIKIYFSHRKRVFLEACKIDKL